MPPQNVELVPETHFDEWMSQRYHLLWPELYEESLITATVSFLADLAGAGPALEFGIGTGRIALPLSERGVRVEGIELSPAMVEQLRSLPGAADVEVTIGDFATAKLAGRFSLVYLLRNTITNLTTQEEQVACFANAAKHLVPGGSFVIENNIPEIERLPPGETLHVFVQTPVHLGFEEFDVARQVAVSRHYWLHDGEVRSFSSPHRYVWPADLDEMASQAGLRLRERWSDWTRLPFDAESRSHISVWQKAGGGR